MMTDEPQRQKIPLIFYRTAAGSEPVREWLKGLEEADRRAIGMDLMRAQWRWPVRMPLCRPMGSGLWEIRHRPSIETDSARVAVPLSRALGCRTWVHQENTGDAG
jgi:hypothetical protein